jgi:hypothetical protein
MSREGRPAFSVRRHGRDAIRVEADGGRIPHLLRLGVEADLLRDLRDGIHELALHLVEHRIVGVAEIHREEDVARDHVARIRLHLHKADRADRERRMVQGDPVHLLDEPRGPEERVLAQAAWGSSPYGPRGR